MDSVHRKGHGGVGAARQDVGQPRHPDDVRRVPAPGALGVKGVDGASGEGPNGVLDEARLVEGVGVDGDLHVVVLGNAERGVNGGGRGAPVLVQLEAQRPGPNLLGQRRLGARVALAEQPKVERQPGEALQHPVNVPLTRRAGRGRGARRGAGATANHGGHARLERRPALLRRDEMDVGVHPARRENQALARHYFGARRDGQPRRHAVLGAGVARLADGRDAPAFDAHVGLDDAPVVQNQGVGDHEVGDVHVVSGGVAALAQAVADDLAAAEFDLLAVGGQVALDLDEQLGVAEAHPVAHRGAVKVGVLLAADLHCAPPKPAVRARSSAASRVPGASRSPPTSAFMP